MLGVSEIEIISYIIFLTWKIVLENIGCRLLNVYEKKQDELSYILCNDWFVAQCTEPLIP